MAGGIRAPLYVHKGEYDAGDMRPMLSDVRGFTIGVVPGTAGDGLKVTAVAGSSARVAVAGGRAWVPLTKGGVRDTRHAHYVDLPSPGVAFNLATASATADRYDLIIARVVDDTDVTAWAEVPLATFAPGDVTAGWTIDVVKGADGGGTPAVPYESYIVLSRVKVRKGVTSLSASDVEDLRFTTTGQGDATVMAPVRAAAGQTVASAATNQSVGGLVYSTDEDRLYVKGATATRPVVYAPQLFPGVTGMGATGWWGAEAPTGGVGRMMWFTGGAVPYDRIGILNFSMRVQAPSGEGWHSAWVLSAGAFQWETLRKYEKAVTGLTPHWATTQVWIPKNVAMDVSIYLYAQNGFAQLDSWQSQAQMTTFPAS
jgi:hypothetical protein